MDEQSEVRWDPLEQSEYPEAAAQVIQRLLERVDKLEAFVKELQCPCCKHLIRWDLEQPLNLTACRCVTIGSGPSYRTSTCPKCLPPDRCGRCANMFGVSCVCPCNGAISYTLCWIRKRGLTINKRHFPNAQHQLPCPNPLTTRHRHSRSSSCTRPMNCGR